MICTGIEAQDHDVNFEAHVQEMPFPEFVLQLEKHTGLKFYYLEDWIKDIRISVSGSKLSLQSTLQHAFRDYDLRFTITEDQEVYISRDQAIIITLPDYLKTANPAARETGVDPGKSLIATGKQYIKGRENGKTETIVVGSGSPDASTASSIIHGKMTDGETGEALIGATIYLHELQKGAITDVDGSYHLVIRPGKYSADFSCMGMKIQQYYLDVRSTGKLDIIMEKSLTSISELVVKSDHVDNVRGSQMGFERLNIRRVKEIPVVLGERDLLQVARMLPGVQSVGEGSSGFNVRGSSADQNMIYVNKVPIYNSSHLFGFFSSINPDIVKDFSLYKSNPPAKYGGRISSFFDISTKQGNRKNYTARGGISPVTSHIALEGPVKRERGAFVVSARSTYSDWILKQLDDPKLKNSKASFYDLAGTLSYELNENNHLKTFAYYSKDRFSLGSSHSYEYSNAGGSIGLKHRFNSRISGDFAAVFGNYSFRTTDQNVTSFAYTHKYSIDHYEARADFKYLSLGMHTLTFGGSATYYILNRGNVEPYGSLSTRTPVNLGQENGVETALYFADEISLTPRLKLYGGLRYSLFMLMGPANVLTYGEGTPINENTIADTLTFSAGQVIKQYAGLEPRVSLNYLVGSDNSVKVSYSRLRQYLFMLSNTYAISPTDQWKLCDYHILPPYADQVSAGYYHDFREIGFSTSLEGYYKWISNMVDYRDGASFIDNPHTELEILQGKQKAWGVEMMIRKNIGKLSGWVAYTYSRSNVVVSSPFPGENINKGKVYPSNYDRPHNLNLVVNYKLNRRLSLSSNLVYITGRPITYPVSVYYSNDLPYLHYSDRNKYRIPDYFRIDLSVNLEGNLKKRKHMHSYWMLNIYNLTGRRNAYSVYFAYEDNSINGYKLSIFGRPVITLSWHFKLGNYASD